MSAQEANEALSSLVLDGIFDEASGSIKYILSQVVLKLQEQGKQLKEQGIHIKHLEQHAKDSESKHEQAMQKASEKHGKEILAIMKQITDATNAKIFEMEKTLATLVYNIQGFEMKVNEQSEAQKRAEAEYQARINNQLSAIDAERKKEVEELKRREEKFQKEEEARLKKLQENEEALKADLDNLKREQRRSSIAIMPNNNNNGIDNSHIVEELEAKMKHELEIEKLKLEKEKMLAEQKMQEEKLNWEKEQADKLMKKEEEDRKKHEEEERKRMKQLEDKIASMANQNDNENNVKNGSKKEKELSEEELAKQREKNLLDRWNTLEKLLIPEDIEKYKKSFHLFDTDHSGTVSAEEVDAMLKSMGIDVPQDEINRLINEVDIDGTGEIDEKEFIIMMVTAESSPEWKQIKNRVADMTSQKVDPSKSIGNRLKELEAFYHTAEAKFRKAGLTQKRLDNLEAKLDVVIQEQISPFLLQMNNINNEMNLFADRFELVEKTSKLIEGKLKGKEAKQRAEETIKRVEVLEEIMPTKLSKADLGDVQISLLNDLKEAFKDNVTKSEMEERLKMKADVTRLGLKADQDIVDAVIERIEKRVENISGDVENIKTAEEAEARHRLEQRKREQEIVDLIGKLNHRVELTAGNVEGDVQRLQSALVGKADRSKVVEILSRLGEMGNSSEALKRIKRRLGDKASKIDLDRVMKLASRLRKNVKSLDNSMKGLSDVDGAAVKCLACDRPLANLSESTILDDGPSFYEEPNPPLGKANPKTPYLIHPLNRAGALRPLGLQFRVQQPRPRTVGATAGTRRKWGGTIPTVSKNIRPYSGTPASAMRHQSNRRQVNNNNNYNNKSSNSSVGMMEASIDHSSSFQAGLSPESHFGSNSSNSPGYHNQFGSNSSISRSTVPGGFNGSSSSSRLPNSSNSFQQMKPLKKFVQGCDGKYYQADSV